MHRANTKKKIPIDVKKYANQLEWEKMVQTKNITHPTSSTFLMDVTKLEFTLYFLQERLFFGVGAEADSS